MLDLRILSKSLISFYLVFFMFCNLYHVLFIVVIFFIDVQFLTSFKFVS